MRIIFVHLSGGRRGTEEVFDQDRVTIGTAPDNDLRFDAASDPAVAPHHAEARVDGSEVLLSNRGSERALFVNTHLVNEIILQDGDLLEVGEGGPILRFRLAPEEVAAAKPLRTLVADAQARARGARRGRVGSATAFVRYLALAVAREASPSVRLAFLLGLVQLVLLLVGLPVLLVATQWEIRQLKAALARLSPQPSVVIGSPVVRELTREVAIFGYVLTVGEIVLATIAVLTLAVMVWLAKSKEISSN